MYIMLTSILHQDEVHNKSTPKMDVVGRGALFDTGISYPVNRAHADRSRRARSSNR